MDQLLDMEGPLARQISTHVLMCWHSTLVVAPMFWADTVPIHIDKPSLVFNHEPAQTPRRWPWSLSLHLLFAIEDHKIGPVSKRFLNSSRLNLKTLVSAVFHPKRQSCSDWRLRTFTISMIVGTSPTWALTNHLQSWLILVNTGIFIYIYIYWLVVSTLLKNISQLGWFFPIYGKIKNVWNHQPVYIYYNADI